MWDVDPELHVVICTAHADYSWGDMVQRLGATERWVVLRKPFDSVEVRQMALAFTRRWNSARDKRIYAESLEDQVAQRTEALEGANAALRNEMAKLRDAERRVTQLAHHDSLTGLPNRRFIETHLKYQIEQAKRANRHLALMSVDLDRFKWVNDTLGHAAGDAVLRTIADRLTASLRSGDCVARPGPEGAAIVAGGTVARLGGDEFVVLLAEVRGREDAGMVARRLVGALSQPMIVEGRELSMSASIGVALQPIDGYDPDTLLRKADAAMYHAKDLGRGNFQFFADAPGRGVGDRLWLDNSLRRAIERNELQVCYQPQLDVDKDVTGAVEALLRWPHAERGMISPAEFIPLADETGLIVELGAWVLRAACRQAAAWQAQGLSIGRIAVNVSPRQLKSRSFVNTVIDALADAGLPGSSLELEITEGALATDRDETERILRRLKETGLHLALDDFGTGYSSLAHLTGWPIDTLKIDRSFVSKLPSDRRSTGIVRAIMALAKSFDVEVVAEGVETHEQLAALRAEGCHRMQGYLFCRPVSAGDLASWSTTKKSCPAFG